MPAWLQELQWMGGNYFCHTAPSFPVFNILRAETWKNSLTELMFMNSHGSEHTKGHTSWTALVFKALTGMNTHYLNIQNL